MDYRAIAERLQHENERLRERIAALETTLGHNINPHIALGLTGQEAALMAALVAREACTKWQLMDALYGHRPDGDEAEIKIVDVFVCKMRKKLRRFGIEIETIWGQGYKPSPAMREKALRLVERAG